MSLPSPSAFGASHPLGVPRPIDTANFFGVRRDFFIHNLMPVPGGCLAYFDGAVYRPYARRLAAWLGGVESGWSGPVDVGEPARYCLLRYGAPAAIPASRRDEMPVPPVVPLREVLRQLDDIHARLADFQLFDLLAMIAEDLGANRFAEVTAPHEWVAAYFR
jgi:hypothetical protein